MEDQVITTSEACLDAIRGRRSIKRFTDRPVSRAELERLLELATLAPNHRMTQPWHFYVFGETAKRRYAEIKASLKSAKVEDPQAAEAVRSKVLEETRRIPAIVAVAMEQNPDPSIREEDYAATFMGIQNMLVAANAIGLGGYIHTGRIMERDDLREVLGVPEEQRVIAILDFGEPEDAPSPKQRAPAAERTRWLD